MNAKLSPQQAAEFAYRLTDGKASPESIAANYRAAAETMAGYAVKAEKSASGKYRGYTAAQALAAAGDSVARSVSVPTAYSALVAA